MSLKHLAIYRARENGTTVEEELAWLEARRQINYEMAFFDEFYAYEKYWHKENIKKLRRKEDE